MRITFRLYYLNGSGNCNLKRFHLLKHFLHLGFCSALFWQTSTTIYFSSLSHQRYLCFGLRVGVFLSIVGSIFFTPAGLREHLFLRINQLARHYIWVLSVHEFQRASTIYCLPETSCSDEEAKGTHPLSWTFGLRPLAVTQSRAL